MLVDIKTKRTEIDSILSLIGQGGPTLKIQDGIYMCPHFSFGNQIQEDHNPYPTFGDDHELGPYGVSDNVEQVLEKYKEWLQSPERKFCISFTRIVKSEQESRYGWRWHKWGDYIGTKNPQHEYLYDEDDDIQEVYCYHIYEIN